MQNLNGNFPLSTLIVAIIVMLIALAQFIVAKKKLSLDLFDRRYAIFEKYVGFLKLAVGTGGRGSVPEDSKLRELAPQARFLFNPAVEEAMLESHRRIDQLWRVNLEMRGNGSPAMILELQHENVRLRAELQSAVETAPALFGPYLDFSKWQ